jgi:plasmid stability protein
MRATLEIDDDVMDAVKAAAAREGRSTDAVVTETLRDRFGVEDRARDAGVAASERPDLPFFPSRNDPGAEPRIVMRDGWPTIIGPPRRVITAEFIDKLLEDDFD